MDEGGGRIMREYESYDRSQCGKERIIYSIIPQGQPYAIGGEGNFTPVFDSTDHFHFACTKCKEIAEVIMVRRHDSYASTPSIYFYLRCPKCGHEGLRKIYLEDTDKHFLSFPTTYEHLAKDTTEAMPGIARRPLTYNPLKILRSLG
jgi:hypothetical protein